MPNVSWKRSSVLLASLVGIAVGAQGVAAGTAPTRLVLNQDVSIENGWARVFVQSGEVTEHRQLDHTEPYCSVEIKQVASADNQFMVAKDEFEIGRIQRKHPDGAGIVPAFMNLEEDPGPYDHEIDLYLTSASQPDVIRLRCNKTVYDPWPEEIRFEEITAALGGVAELRY